VSAIAGIGTDLVKMDRIDRAWQRHPERFPEKILGADELRVFRARAARDRARGVRYLATRFAAKEAFSKAIGLGMRMPMWWTRMQTLNAPGGRPRIVLSAPLDQWYAERYGAAHVSLTDESEYGAAYVVVESLPANLPVN
jgi:holo-[acyl-carrier protein] synthase